MIMLLFRLESDVDDFDLLGNTQSLSCFRTCKLKFTDSKL